MGVSWLFSFQIRNYRILLHLLKTLRTKMTKNFLYLGVLCIVQMHSHTLFILILTCLKKGLWFLYKPINANLISFDGQGHFFKNNTTAPFVLALVKKQSRGHLPTSTVETLDRYSIQFSRQNFEFLKERIFGIPVILFIQLSGAK